MIASILSRGSKERTTGWKPVLPGIQRFTDARKHGRTANSRMTAENRGQKKPGDDLLSHGLTHSTIGAPGLNCRVRKGNGCFPRAIITRKFDGMMHMADAFFTKVIKPKFIKP